MKNCCCESPPPELRPLIPSNRSSNRDYFSWICLFVMFFTVSGFTAAATWMIRTKGGLFHSNPRDNATNTSRSFQALDNNNTDTPSPFNESDGVSAIIALAALTVAVFILAIICCHRDAMMDRARAFFKKPAIGDRTAEEMDRLLSSTGSIN